jgi:hypothetical protein
LSKVFDIFDFFGKLIPPPGLMGTYDKDESYHGKITSVLEDMSFTHQSQGRNPPEVDSTVNMFEHVTTQYLFRHYDNV